MLAPFPCIGQVEELAYLVQALSRKCWELASEVTKANERVSSQAQVASKGKGSRADRSEKVNTTVPCLLTCPDRSATMHGWCSSSKIVALLPHWTWPQLNGAKPTWKAKH